MAIKLKHWSRLVNPEYQRKIEAAACHMHVEATLGIPPHETVRYLRERDADPVFLAECERISRKTEE